MLNSIDLRQHQFKSTSYASPVAGPRIIITGAVHGNEICGTIAIRRVIEELNSGHLQQIAGTLTLVPVVNTLAYQLGQRHGHRNLNRRLRPTQQIDEFEDHVANWLCPLLAQHEILLDLHSFRGKGSPFVMVGPENNDDAVEPFGYAAEEEILALRLGVSRFVDGWLSTYARGVERRRARLHHAADHHALQNADPQFGVGTTEYMRSVGGHALTLECGQHQDPMAPQVAYQAILNTLRQLGVLAGDKPQVAEHREALRIYDVVDKLDAKDSFSREWASFDPLAKGDLIGTRSDGSTVVAEMDGCIIFPDANAAAGEEWFYLAKHNPRFYAHTK